MLNQITEVEFEILLEKVRKKTFEKISSINISKTSNYHGKDLIILKSHKVHDDSYTAVRVCTT